MGRGRSMRVAVLAVSACLLAGPTWQRLARPAARAADACTAEIKLDDAPEQAQTISGAACITAALPEGDELLFIWQLSAEQRPERLDHRPQRRAGHHRQRVPAAHHVRGRGHARRGREQPDPAGQQPRLRTTAADAGVPGAARGATWSAFSRSGTPTGGTPVDLNYQVSLVQGSSRPPSGDREPNDDPGHATPVSGDFALSGDVQSSADDYAWTVSAADAGERWQLDWQLQLSTSSSLSLETAERPAAGAGVCHAGRSRPTPRPGPPGRQIHPGSGRTGSDPRPYRLTASHEPGSGDPEPNDDAAHAVTLGPDRLVATGRISQDSGDVDDYRLHVDDQLATLLLDIRLLWRGGPERHALPLRLATRNWCADGQDGGDALANLFLPVGDYTIEVRGAVSLRPLRAARRPDDRTGARLRDRTQRHGRHGLALDAGVVMLGAADRRRRRLLPRVGGRRTTALPARREPASHDRTCAGSTATEPSWPPRTCRRTPGTRRWRTCTSSRATTGSASTRVGDYSLAAGARGSAGSQLPSGNRTTTRADAQPLAIGHATDRQAARDSDLDIYRFSLTAPERLHMTLTPPADGAVTWGLFQAATRTWTVRGPPTSACPSTRTSACRPAITSSGCRPARRVSKGHYTVETRPRGSVHPAAPLAATVSVSTTTRASPPTGRPASTSDGKLDHQQRHHGRGAEPRRAHQPLRLGVRRCAQTQVTWRPAHGHGAVLRPRSSRTPGRTSARVTVRAATPRGRSRPAFAELTPSADARAGQPRSRRGRCPTPLLGGLERGRHWRSAAQPVPPTTRPWRRSSTTASRPPVPASDRLPRHVAGDAHHRPRGRRRPCRWPASSSTRRPATRAIERGPQGLRAAALERRQPPGRGLQRASCRRWHRPGLRAAGAGAGALRTAAHHLDLRRRQHRCALGEFKVIATPGTAPSATAARTWPTRPRRPHGVDGPAVGRPPTALACSRTRTPRRPCGQRQAGTEAGSSASGTTARPS